MKTVIISVIVSLFAVWSNDNLRIINYRNKDVKTTFKVPEKFIGEYKGKKSGYLILNEDGSGIYNYEIFGFAPANCLKQPIVLEWGFMVDENNTILKFEREYGHSYPLLLKSVGPTSFKGCRDEVMLDFIMEYEDGSLGVSSSDDWKK